MQAERVSRSQRRRARRRRSFINLARLILIFGIVVSVVTVLGFTVYYSFTNGLFDVKEISVEGVEILTEDQIIEASKITTGENIFLIDLNKARYNINEVISAKEIYIRRIFPDQIVIQINENDPIGVIKVDDKHYYLDSSGKVMEVTAELGKDDTPIISGFDKYDFGDDGSVTVDKQYKFQTILDMLMLFDQNHLLSELSQISLTPQNEYEIITKKGVLFTVKDLENLQSYFDYIALVIENGETNQDINLYSGNNPIKKSR